MGAAWRALAPRILMVAWATRALAHEDTRWGGFRTVLPIRRPKDRDHQG